MPRLGLEQAEEIVGYLQLLIQDGAEGGAFLRQLVSSDPRLEKVLVAWPNVPDEVKEEVIQKVLATTN